MKHVSKILFTTLTLATLAGTAAAQDAVEGEAPAEGEAAAETTGEAAPAEAAPAEEAPAPVGQGVGPFTKESYPSALIDRPLTLPAGMIEVRPSIQHQAISISTGGVTVSGSTTALLVGAGYGMIEVRPSIQHQAISISSGGVTVSGSMTALLVGAGYGITDKLEVGLGTGLVLDPDVEWTESLGLYGAFSLHDTAKMDIAPSLSTSLNFAEGADVLSGFSIGAGFRYLVSDKLFVRAGNNLLNFGIEPEVGLQLNVNAGVGFQATPELAVAVDLNMISIKVFGDAVPDSAFFDPFGLSLTGLYAISNKLDVYAGVQLPSLADAGDFYGFSVGANVRL